MNKESMNVIEAFVKLKKEGGAIHPLDYDDFTYRWDGAKEIFYQYDELRGEPHNNEPTDKFLDVSVADIFKIWVHITEEELTQRKMIDEIT